jgi:hypothetical protein
MAPEHVTWVWVLPYNQDNGMGLPDPDSLSFIGALFRWAVPKLEITDVQFQICENVDCTIRSPNIHPTKRYAEADTVGEALFLACEKAFGLEEE